MNMKGLSSLNKYMLGLLALGVFTLILLVMVLSQAGATKQDNTTYNKATDIANKLNSYVDTNLTLPSSLSEAGINNVPSTITYTKINYTKYRFCVEYKTKSDNFDPYSAESQLLTASGYGGNVNQVGGSSSFDLYIDSSHNKGENCQTIDAQLSQNTPINNNNNSNNNSSDPYAKCYSIQDNTAYQQCVTSVDNSLNTQTN
jgi:hypothetical protein